MPVGKTVIGTTEGGVDRQPEDTRMAPVSLVLKSPKRKKASEYRKTNRLTSNRQVLMPVHFRISPRHSPAPLSSSEQRTGASQLPSSTASAPAPEPEPELELDLNSPPPVEDTLAARRARRQAILAKYAGTASINTSQTATPSPGPSSAAEPPTAVSAVSDLASSQLQSVAATPPVSVTPGASVPPDGKPPTPQSASAS